MTPTTRRHPRTLYEAFPQDFADKWIEPPPPNTTWRNITLLVVAVVLWVMLAYILAADAKVLL